MPNSQPAVAQLNRWIGEIAAHRKVRERARSVTSRYLGHIVGTELQQISEDALSECVMKLLDTLEDGTSKLDVSDLNTLDLEAIKDPNNDAVLATSIAKYLIGGVNNYCHTRRSRWAFDEEEKEFGARARVVFKDEKESEDFFDHHLTVDEQERLDTATTNVDGLLEEKGVSTEDIQLIKEKLSGRSFVELAEKHGGTADKHRRRVERALDKAGLKGSIKL